MLLHATITQGKVNVFKYTKHIAIKKYTSEQNLIKTTKHLQNIRKKKQDSRIDLPAVGLDTLKQCKAVGLKGVVLKHNKNIFLDRIKSIKFANKNKMFILVK